MKRCLPHAPRVEPFAGYAPEPNRGKAGEEPVRLDFCPRAGTCLTIAEIKGWLSLSCVACSIFIELKDHINNGTKEAILRETTTANWGERQIKTSTG